MSKVLIKNIVSEVGKYILAWTVSLKISLKSSCQSQRYLVSIWETCLCERNLFYIIFHGIPWFISSFVSLRVILSLVGLDQRAEGSLGIKSEDKGKRTVTGNCEALRIQSLRHSNYQSLLLSILSSLFRILFFSFFGNFLIMDIFTIQGQWL